jgi:hypothetical protein
VTAVYDVSELRTSVALLEQELGLTQKQVIGPGAPAAADSLLAGESLSHSRVPADLARRIAAVAAKRATIGEALSAEISADAEAASWSCCCCCSCFFCCCCCCCF